MNRVFLVCGALLLALPLVLGGHAVVSADTVGSVMPGERSIESAREIDLRLAELMLNSGGLVS